MCRYRVTKVVRYFIHEYYNCVCVYCKTSPSETLDHVVPLYENGLRGNMENLVPCCNKCNQEKGKQRLEEHVENEILEKAFTCAKVVRKQVQNIGPMITFSILFHSGKIKIKH